MSEAGHITTERQGDVLLIGLDRVAKRNAFDLAMLRALPEGARMVLSKQAICDLYRKRARHYDLALRIYGVLGFRWDHYRRETVNALALQPGDMVVDLACGTGLNFPLLEQAVGANGRIIGVDVTQAMLDQAHRRVRTSGWQNVDLIQADLARYAFPPNVGGILSTLAITLVAEYDDVIRNGAAALRPGGRMAILDLKKPEQWPEWLIRFGAWLNKPFGVSIELADRHPWESLRRHLGEVLFREYYFGGVYLAVGEAPKR